MAEVGIFNEIVLSDHSPGGNARIGTVFLSGNKLYFVKSTGAHSLVTST